MLLGTVPLDAERRLAKSTSEVRCLVLAADSCSRVDHNRRATWHRCFQLAGSDGPALAASGFFSAFPSFSFLAFLAFLAFFCSTVHVKG